MARQVTAAKRPTLTPDADLTNADWTKQTWDLPATNVKELRAWLKANGRSVESFKKLPLYRLNVAKLPWLKQL